MKIIFRISFLLLISWSLSSCFGIKLVGAGGAANRLYKDFYTKEGITQYFITELSFKAKEAKLKIDFTFKDYGFDTTTVIANHSLFMKNAVVVESIKFITEADESFEAESTENLYMENKTEFLTRNSSIMRYKPIQKFFMNPSYIEITTKSGILKFYPKSKTNRKIKKLNSRIFDLIELKNKD